MGRVGRVGRVGRGRNGGQERGADGSSLGWDWNTVICDLYLCVWGGGCVSSCLTKMGGATVACTHAEHVYMHMQCSFINPVEIIFISYHSSL